MPVKKTNYNAPALEKGLDILEYLSLKATSLTQTQIAKGIDRSTNEIYRMLVSLEERGYLIREATSGKYRLSLKLYTLAHRHSPVDEIRNVAQYPMQELSGITKQSCHLSVVYHDHIMVIYQSKSPGPISISVEEGSLFSLVLTASGRTLLAFTKEEERLELLSKNKTFQQYSSAKQQKFLKSLDKIYNQGYYAKKSEVTRGVTDVVVPIGDSSTTITASLAVSILTTQIDEIVSLEEIIASAQNTAKNILHQLGLETEQKPALEE